MTCCKHVVEGEILPAIDLTAPHAKCNAACPPPETPEYPHPLLYDTFCIATHSFDGVLVESYQRVASEWGFSLSLRSSTCPRRLAPHRS